MRIGVIAWHTFLEAVRNRVLYLLLVFGALMILLSKALGWVLIGETLKVITDVSLMTLSVFGALITIFLGTQMIYNEIDKRTIYVLLARPVPRWQFVIGKYLGLLLTVLTMIAALSLIFLAYLALMSSGLVEQETTIDGGRLSVAYGPVIYAIAMTMMEMVMLTAMAIAFSAASTPILSAVFTFLTYIVGHQADNVRDLPQILAARNPGAEPGFAHDAIMALYYLMPNLSKFNVRNEVAHGLTGQYGWGTTFQVVLYGLLYSAVFLTLGILVFRRRNF